MADAATMVELWGSILGTIGNILAVWTITQIFDSFFPRRKSGNVYLLFIAAWMAISVSSSLFFGLRFGYTFKIVYEVTLYCVMCAILYQSRWDRRLFVVVTVYAVLYSSTYWFDLLCLTLFQITYEEYVWNIPLYSAMFLLRVCLILGIAILIKKFHRPLSVGRQARAWVPLSAVFPLATLLVIWQVYTYPEQQKMWQVCLLILDVVDIAALILLDQLEQSSSNREKLIAAGERARVQDENIQALSQAYAGQRKMTHDYRAQLSTLSELLEGGKLDEAKEFLSEMKVRQSERILLINSHNAAIDAVLNQKGYTARQRGIDMRFRVNDLSALKLPRVDVTIVLGNLIDNAMEACADLPEPERWVSIQILYSRKVLSLSIINASRPVAIADGQIPTSKPAPLLHGFGLGNVKDILEKYQAEYSFAFEDGRFIFTAGWPDVEEK